MLYIFEEDYPTRAASGCGAKEPAARTNGSAPGTAERTVIGFVTVNLEVQQGLGGDRKFNSSAAAVNQSAHANDASTRFFDDAHGLERRASCGPNIFDDEDMLVGLNLKSAPKGESAGLVALDEHRARSSGRRAGQRARHFLPQDQATQRGRRNAIHPQVVKFGGQSAP